MRFFVLTRLQISFLAGLLIFGLSIIFLHLLNKSSWTSVFTDRYNEKILDIQSLNFVSKNSLSDFEIKSIINGDSNFPVEKIDVFNFWRDNNFEKTNKQSEQIEKNLAVSKKKSLLGLKTVFFVDLDRKNLIEIGEPYVFFYKINTPWKLYANGKLVASCDPTCRYSAIKLPEFTNKMRLSWILTNRRTDRINGFSFQHGISIRSAEEASWAQRMLPMQHELPRIISCIFFLCFSLFALILGFSMPRFTDLWSFSAFTGTMFFAIWAQTPFYWESFEVVGGQSPSYLVANSIANASFIFAAVTLTLSFFRVKGYYLWLIILLTASWLTGIIAYHWPYGQDLPMYRLQAAIDAKLVIALATSQIISFIFGYYSLTSQYLVFKTQGLNALLPPMKRRFGEAIVFNLAMFAMLGAYLLGMPLQSMTAGPDLFLLWALLPASVMFIQFYWMMGASTRFREKLLPQLDYIDYLVLELKEKAFKQKYWGVLAAFDLMGFKKITALKEKSPSLSTAIDNLLKAMQSDISDLASKGKTIFRYKSNGDEWLFALYAKDQKDAETILTELVLSWNERGAALMKLWKESFKAAVPKEEWDQDVENAINYLDLHVMICMMRDMMIKVEDKKSRPDYICDSFTLLTPAFKNATHTKIAMYEEEAGFVLQKLSHQKASFESLNDKIGHLFLHEDQQLKKDIAPAA